MLLVQPVAALEVHLDAVARPVVPGRGDARGDLVEVVLETGGRDDLQDPTRAVAGVPEGVPLLARLERQVAGWRDAGAGVAARIHQLGLLAGLAALAWFLWQWNLIGWQFS